MTRLAVRLAKKAGEGGDIETFTFEYDAKSFRYTAGQYTYLSLDQGMGRESRHQFSIASSPTEPYLMFTTRIRQGSLYKSRLSSLKEGDTAFVEPAGGRFVLPEGDGRACVMIGGGIGITPFRSMVKYATDTGRKLTIVLIYSCKTSQEIVYRDFWAECEKLNPRFHHVVTLTEQSGGGWTGRTGRIDEALIREQTAGLDSPLFYVCGPPAMVTAEVNLLLAMGKTRGEIKVESFTGY